MHVNVYVCVCMCVCHILKPILSEGSPMCASVCVCVCVCIILYSPSSPQTGLTICVYMCVCVYIILYRDSPRNLSPRTEASPIGAVLPTKMRGGAGAALHLGCEGDGVASPSVRLGSPGERGGGVGRGGRRQQGGSGGRECVLGGCF